MRTLTPLSRLELRKQKKTVVSTAITLCAGLGVALIALLTQRRWPTSELLGVCSGLLAYLTPFVGVVLGSSAASGLLQEIAFSTEETLPLSRYKRFLAAYKVSLVYFAVATVATLLIPFNLKALGQYNENPTLAFICVILLFKMHLLAFMTSYVTRASFLSSCLSALVVLFELPALSYSYIFRFTSINSEPNYFAWLSFILIGLYFILQFLMIWGIFKMGKFACRRMDSESNSKLYRWAIAIISWITGPAITILHNYFFYNFYLSRLYE